MLQERLRSLAMTLSPEKSAEACRLADMLDPDRRFGMFQPSPEEIIDRWAMARGFLIRETGDSWL